MICMVYGWLIKPSKEPISWKFPALISVECSKETLCLAWNFHMSCVSDGRLSLVVCLSLSVCVYLFVCVCVCLSLSVCVYLSVCVSLRAFIEFPRDSADGSAGRVLPAVYVALKLRFVFVSQSLHKQTRAHTYLHHFNGHSLCEPELGGCLPP